MAINTQKSTGTPESLKTDRGGASLIREPRIGIVKDTIDACRSGIIKVYISGLQQTNNPDDSASWIPVRYMSPFYGYLDSSSPGDTAGDFKNNPQSYGFWATPPDIGTEVVCIFVNGAINQGYYIGCIPKVEVHNMVPAVAPGASRVQPNQSEATSFGGADVLPTTEINTNNSGINDSVTFYDQTKPIHSYQAAIFFNQGLIRDQTRGVISSSTYRETPSRVFGISTPGSEIYEGGFNNRTIKTAIASENNPKKFKVIGRTGGHSLVMDDGDIEGFNQQIRLRSAGGHQITMSDDGQTLFIIHSNGQSWIELNSEGAIDVFSTNSFNVRTLGDLNFHADQHINMHAGKDFRIKANTIGIESDTTYTNRAGTDMNTSTGKQYTVYASDAMALQSSGEASITSNGADVVVKGQNVQLNTKNAAVNAPEVPPNKPKNFPDTTFSQAKGWINSPGKLESITTRVTSHYPMPDINGTTGGVEVTANLTAPSSPPEPPPQTTAVLDAAPPLPEAPTSPTVAAANSNLVPETNNALPATTNNALISQQATNNSLLTAAAANAKGLVGAKVADLSQMATGGLLKPGADVIAQRKLDAGFPAVTAITSNLLTGAQGATNPQQLLNNASAQAGAFVTAVNKGVAQLQNTGAITANLAPTQIAGMAMAAANQGIATVTSALSGNAQALSKIGNDIASGNFASGLADKLAGGLNGVGASIGGVLAGAAGAIGSAVGAIGDAIKGAAGKLQSMAEQAFRGIEASFVNLKGNIPNTLGGGSPVIQLSDTAKSLSNVEALYQDVRSKLNAYYADKTEENKAAWDEAGKKLKQALAEIEKNKNAAVAESTGGIDYSAVGGSLNAQNMTALSNKITSGIAEVATTATSGLNALPGGVNSVMNTVTKSVAGTNLSNPLTSISNVVGNTVNSIVSTAAGAVNGLVGSVTGAVTGAFKSLGSNVTNVASAVSAPTAALDAVKGNLTKASGALTGPLMSKLGGLGAMASEIKTPTVATGTFNNTALVAKAGTLVGDASIPAPVFTVEPKKPEEPDAQQSSLEEAYQKVQEAEAVRKKLVVDRRNIQYIYDSKQISATEYIALLKGWLKQADVAQKNYDDAEAAYAALLKGESAGDGTAT
jgi:hypothetical protein